MTRGEKMERAQKQFNRYIRARDHGLPCISCGRPFALLKKINAGHYRSVGSCPELRFCELNVHLQCEYCNTSLSGNAIAYRRNLIYRIGHSNVEWIEGPHAPLRLRDEEIEEIRAKYAKKARDIEKLIR